MIATEFAAISTRIATADSAASHVYICRIGSAPTSANTRSRTAATPVCISDPAAGPPERTPTRPSRPGSTRSRPSAKK